MSRRRMMYGGYDSSDKNTLVLLHADETTTDEFANFIHSGGTPTYSYGKFGQSFSFNGTSGSWLMFKSLKVIPFNGTQITIEFFINRTTANAQQTIFACLGSNDPNTAAAGGFEMRLTNNGVLISAAGAYTVINALGGDAAINAIGYNQWSHVALTKDGGSYTLFVNGVKYPTLNGLGTGFRNGYYYVLGRYTQGEDKLLSAKLDEFRISDTIRYTEDFTVPTKPFK